MMPHVPAVCRSSAARTLPYRCLGRSTNRTSGRRNRRVALEQGRFLPRGYTSQRDLLGRNGLWHAKDAEWRERRDRKSTRLNSSHQIISYAVFCLKKKKKND